MKRLLSTQDRILDQLRGDIIGGKLLPGEPLRQEEIARSFGVSHVPIRETFLKLEAEGLVEIRPRRGAIVAHLSALEIEELNEMRTALECCALRIAIPKFTESDFKKAASILEHIDRRPDRWAELNSEFHSALYKPSERPRLGSAILSLQRNVERYLRHEVKVANNLAASQREHRKLLTLIRRGQAEEACTLLARHINEPGRLLASELRQSGNT